MAVIGKPIDRKDARLKVTGTARYAAEFQQVNLAYAFPVRSTIGNGRIKNIDRSAAEKSSGVLTVMTYKNAPRLKQINVMEVAQYGTIPGEMLLPLQEDVIHYVGQYVALVVAETYEQARQAAALVKVEYEQKKAAIEMERAPVKFKPEKFFGFEDAQPKRGDAGGAMNAAAVKFEQRYSTPVENHHPMETHATIAVWDNGGALTVYDATQAVMGTQVVMAQTLGVELGKVRIISPFVGGGFGCKGLVWMHPVLAAMAAQAVKRPVKIVLTRQMMQTNIGHRGETKQQVALGANRDGRLMAIRHLNETYTSNLSEFFEPSGLTTRLIYACPNVEITHEVARLNVGTPTPMRAPGESPGSFALESAMDELAYELKIDPVQIRVINHADVNPQTNLPWSSKKLKECYSIGAEKFGWSKRKVEPRQMRDGRFLVGYGMATASYPGYRANASARVRLNADGTAVVSSATQDIGTGTYTVIAQIASEFLGIPVERIEVKIGDSSLPPAPTSGGSQSVASVGPAVQAACAAVRKKIFESVSKDNASPFFGKTENEIAFGDGRMFFKSDASKGGTYKEILERAKMQFVEECVTSNMAGQQSGAPCSPFTAAPEENGDVKKYAFQSFGAQFAEVGVDEDLGIVRVRRFTSVQDIGRVMNEKTARSQVYSGVIYGIGMALMEETHYDRRNARPVVRNLADYHVPVHLDVPPIDVYFVGEPDPHINTLGARGIGEIGITGVAAAIANAVFNATGKRVRDLPITPDKLL